MNRDTCFKINVKRFENIIGTKTKVMVDTTMHEQLPHIIIGTMYLHA